MQRAERMQRLGTETAFEVLAKVNELKRKGKDVISFCTVSYTHLTLPTN